MLSKKPSTKKMKLIQKAVERKQQKGQKAVVSSTHAQAQKITEGGNRKSTAKVCKGQRNTGLGKRLSK